MDDKFNEWAKEYFGASDLQVDCDHKWSYEYFCSYCELSDQKCRHTQVAKAAWIAATKAAGEK